MGFKAEPMDIRRNDISALPAFAALNIAWIKELHVVEPSDQHMFDHPESYITGRDSVFSLHIDGEVAGVCALKEDDHGEFELTKMAVDPRFQGRGIGQILMTATEDYARNDLGLKSIYLISNTINAAAIRLYKRCGWTISFEGPHPKYARADIGMEKQL